MLCPKCGAEVGGFAFCTNCGTRMPSEAQPHPDWNVPLDPAPDLESAPTVDMNAPSAQDPAPDPTPASEPYQPPRQQYQPPQQQYQQPQQQYRPPQQQYQQPQQQYQPPQQQYQPPQQQYQQPQAGPAAPGYRLSSELSEKDLPARFKPLSAWAYFGYGILFSIPLVGFILLIVFSFNGENINRRNYARSFFCFLVVIAVIVVILLISGVSLASMFSGMARRYY